MENELEEKEQIKAKIIEDIDYLKAKEQEIQTALARIFSDDVEEAASVAKALDTIQISGISYINNEVIKDLKSFYTNISHPLAIASKAFLIDISNKSSRYKLIEAAKAFNNITNKISEANTTKDISVKTEGGRAFVVGSDLDRKIDALSERIENLETKPDEIIDTLKKTLEDAEYSSRNAKEFADKAKSSYSDTFNYVDKMKYELNTIIVKSNETLNHNISMVLTEQLQDKATKLKEEALQKLGNISWNPLKFLGFYGAIEIALVVNITIWIIYFIMTCIVSLDFWHFMIFKLTINIPLFVYVAFTLNEYTKAKKLYEEFDYKRIMAQTLMNNFALFKKELLGNDTSVSSNEKLLNLIKTPLEKIFDNPVHSIYGDKSGDKNIGLDQLEKFASIFEKMKK
ncbi:hypothetical protein [Sulfurimonas sp. RIFOXYB12_FULL_35_9]|uniref:hypothetical protein n=1 Tax=Sulfurimonas sp. RIFOXYB12_FULL_35_9 TaxID=1802256 RepID=UPI0008B2C0C6|nr:hypothetical protein [Sulfurimonas sp. RIFOXYB12_FULL_35_9]MBS4068228.1 hypothetical protein [Sulfurimonas sp.]MDX9757056.1 hypothetical protein [Sulfurimonas sp.]OHE05908.1 MAG: hypothetical protein A2345_10470 [Sulfurimonas sp. RIFOXYB12_FULL_35_9]